VQPLPILHSLHVNFHLLGIAIHLVFADVVVARDFDFEGVAFDLARDVLRVFVVVGDVGVAVGDDVVLELLDFSVGLFPVHRDVDVVPVGRFGEGVGGFDWDGAVVVLARWHDQVPGSEERLALHSVCWLDTKDIINCVQSDLKDQCKSFIK
jgi:hypothetical protein